MRISGAGGSGSGLGCGIFPCAGAMNLSRLFGTNIPALRASVKKARGADTIGTKGYSTKNQDLRKENLRQRNQWVKFSVRYEPKVSREMPQAGEGG